MVTILKPAEVIPDDAAVAPGTLPDPLAVPPPAWGYTIPCPGVRYYTRRAAAKPKPPACLPVKLLDEKVISL